MKGISVHLDAAARAAEPTGLARQLACRHGAPQIRIDVIESERQYLAIAEIPGVRKQDIDIRIDGNQVSIGAELQQKKLEKKGSRVVCSERRYGFASRSLTRASAVDDATADAEYKDGVPELNLRKCEQASQKRLAVG